jgi:hypothetical protein
VKVDCFGDGKHFHSKIFPFSIQSGSPSEGAHCLRYITQRKKAETSRRKNAGAAMRTTDVSHFRELPAAEPNRAAVASAVVCKDCRAPLPLDLLVPVDALHVQCPHCLFVFFLEPGIRRQL